MGHALVLEDRLSLPNGQPIPNDGAGRGLKHGIDTWLAAQSPIVPTTVSFTCEVPPHVPSKHTHQTSLALITQAPAIHDKLD